MHRTYSTPCASCCASPLVREVFSPEVIDGVRAVTRIEGESYEAFIARAALDPVGKAVKLADLAENSDLSRIGAPTQEDLERVEKYRRAIKRLMSLQ